MDLGIKELYYKNDRKRSSICENNKALKDLDKNEKILNPLAVLATMPSVSKPKEVSNESTLERPNEKEQADRAKKIELMRL